MDPQGRDFRRYRGATLIKPHLKELAEATGRPISGDGDIEKAARQLIADCGTPAVLVTRGAAGMMLVRENEPPRRFAPGPAKFTMFRELVTQSWQRSR